MYTLAMMMSMPLGKLVWSIVGVMWVMHSENRVSHLVVAVRGRWMGYLSRSWMSRHWSAVCASGS